MKVYRIIIGREKKVSVIEALLAFFLAFLVTFPVNFLFRFLLPLVGFTDEIFTYDMDCVERICDLIVDRGTRKNYIIKARLEIARHPAVIRKMELAGFAMLLLGIESAQDKTLRAMRKGFNTTKIRHSRLPRLR